MSEYIVDVGDADEEYIEHFGYMATAYADNPIRELIVRCKDCKHYNEISGTYGLCQSYQWSDYAIEVYPIDYCSYGERREQ